LTLRALLTGVGLGSLLSICTVYVGLKLGQTFGVSLTAALLAYAIWATLRPVPFRGKAPFGILENNISQTAASAAATVAPAGLVAPIPALALLTGRTLPWHLLALWMFSVMLLGICVALMLRRRMIAVEALPFPAGVASAEILRELHTRGREALRRVAALLGSAVVAVGVTLGAAFRLLAPYALPFAVRGTPLDRLTITLNPTLLPVGIGGLIGFGACCSLLVGAILAYLVIAPWLISSGIVTSSTGGPPGYRELNHWLVWPGVALMVVGSLLPVLLFLFDRMVDFLGGDTSQAPAGQQPARPDDVPHTLLYAALGGVLVLSVALQMALFGIVWWAAVLGVALSFALAHVAARVTGETGMGAVGPMGKITQLAFGAVLPRTPVANLMAANVTGGAASQCADLLDDLKCGHLLGASPRAQALAQLCGAAAGAVVGSAAYLLLIPDAATMLATAEWPAPAAALWKSVAELFVVGFDALPRHVPAAMALAACAGAGLVALRRFVPSGWRRFVLSPVSLGLAFVLPASLSVSIFCGGLLAVLLRRWFADWSARYLVVICVGLIAGESLTGVGLAVYRVFGG